jgi:hypothetical protein
MHGEFMEQFDTNDRVTIPGLIETLHTLKSRLADIPPPSVEERLDIRDQIHSINEQVRTLRRSKTDYLLDNAKYVFKYFETKKGLEVMPEELDNGTAADPGAVDPPAAATNSKTHLVNSLFGLVTMNDGNTVSSSSSAAASAASAAATSATSSSDTIVQQYLNNVSDEHINLASFIRQTDVCEACHRGEMIPLEDDGFLSCNQCGVSVRYLADTEKPSYKEPPKEVCFYAYKKINHFKEILSQFQGKETTYIPPEILDQIIRQVKKERIGLNQLTYYKTKDILRNLGLNKYYEHIAFIKNHLGVPPPVFSAELEETLCNLFIDIQAPYAKCCPDNRVNFLNYYYVLFKFCELLGERQYLPFIPLLKDRDKLIEQDSTWSRMCRELNWEFNPTLTVFDEQYLFR